MPEEPVLWVGSRSLTAQDVERIRWTLRRFGALSPTALARTLGENPLWTAPIGRLKVLPRPAAAAAGLRCHPPPPRARLGSQGPLRVPGHGAAQPRAPDRARPHPRRARGHAERPDCNAMLAAYHPLGFRRACGAQQRSGGREQASGRPHILGGSSLPPRPSPWPSATPGSARRPSSVGAASTASWPTAATSCCPTSPCRNLARHVLARALRRLPGDWRRRYGFALADTCVERPWAGTSYRAANSIHLGQTPGRGRQNRTHASPVPVKAFCVYPLARNWRERLLAPPPPVLHHDADP